MASSSVSSKSSKASKPSSIQMDGKSWGVSVAILLLAAWAGVLSYFVFAPKDEVQSIGAALAPGQLTVHSATAAQSVKVDGKNNQILGARHFETITPAAVDIKDDETKDILTAAQLRGGMIVLETAATLTGAYNVVLPTAVAVLAALPGASVGTSIVFNVSNLTAETANLSLPTSSGITLPASAGIATATNQQFMLRFTNVTTGTVAATLYRI